MPKLSRTPQHVVYFGWVGAETCAFFGGLPRVSYFLSYSPQVRTVHPNYCL